METKPIIIDSFVGGMVSEPRGTDYRFSQILQNFDAHSYAKKLVPFRSSESGDNAAATSQKQNFCVALRTGTTYSLYALGVASGQTYATILYKNLTTGAATDLDDDDWATPANANNVGSGGTITSFNLFVYYKKVNSGKGLIYGAHANGIWSFSPGDATAFADSSGTYHTLAHTNIAQGLVHSKDDIFYIPYDNKIAKNDNGSWTDAALTLPTHYKITSICEYGNYLAIACAPLSGVGNSVVYLWDRDSSLTTLTESIDWGEGVLTILEQIEGYLIGISYKSTATIRASLIFRQYSGGIPIVFNQIVDDGGGIGAITLSSYKQKVNQYLYFLFACTINGTEHRGLWKVGRNSPTSPFSVVIDRNITNAETTNTPTYGFFIVGDYVFISYATAGGATPNNLSKTDADVFYTATSAYESLIFNLGDSSKKKKLVGITVSTEELPALGQVVLKYKKDEDIDGTTWTTIFTKTYTTPITLTDDNISHSAVNLLPEFKEIVFRIESTGGAVITGLKFKADLMDKDLY